MVGPAVDGLQHGRRRSWVSVVGVPIFDANVRMMQCIQAVECARRRRRRSAMPACCPVASLPPRPPHALADGLLLVVQRVWRVLMNAFRQFLIRDVRVERRPELDTSVQHTTRFQEGERPVKLFTVFEPLGQDVARGGTAAHVCRSNKRCVGKAPTADGTCRRLGTVTPLTRKGPPRKFLCRGSLGEADQNDRLFLTRMWCGGKKGPSGFDVEKVSMAVCCDVISSPDSLHATYDPG